MKLKHQKEVILISSQRFRDPEVIQEKRDEEDYRVYYVEFQYEDELYYLIVDGHHRYDAARADGEDATFFIHEKLQDELSKINLMDFLLEVKIDSPYYNMETMEDIEW